MRTAAANGPIVPDPNDRQMDLEVWRVKAKALGENPVPLPLCSPQIPHALLQELSFRHELRIISQFHQKCRGRELECCFFKNIYIRNKTGI
jgi:hypothetical protein